MLSLKSIAAQRTRAQLLESAGVPAFSWWRGMAACAALNRRAQAKSAAALLVLSAVAAMAAQPWSKDSKQWTTEEARHIMLNSPWSQAGSAFFGPPLSPEDIPPPPLPGAAEAGVAGPQPHTGAGWDGGPGRDTTRGRTPTLPVTIRWDSALPLREAILKLPAGDRAPGDTYTAAQLEKDYIITVMGLVPAGRYTSAGNLHKDSQSSSDDNDSGVKAQDPEQLLEGLMGASRLAPRDQQPIRPEDVKLDPSTGTLHLFFPRTAGIRAGAKEVTFMTQFGSMRLAQKFRLKEMMYRGRLEL